MYKSSTFFDPKWKLREHIAVFVLALLVLILTGVYINLAPRFGRADIMGIVYVSALRSSSVTSGDFGDEY
jgi:hypothetical protein